MGGPGFKEKNGITRLQHIIQRAKELGSYLPEEVWKLAGVISPRIGQLVKAFNLVESDSKVDPMVKEQVLEAIDLAIQEMENVTERHHNDNTSDHAITAYTRPIIAFAITAYVIFEGLSDRFSWGIASPERFTQMMDIMENVALFFFGGRTAEKIIRTLVPPEKKTFKLFNRKSNNDA